MAVMAAAEPLCVHTPPSAHANPQSDVRLRGRRCRRDGLPPRSLCVNMRRLTETMLTPPGFCDVCECVCFLTHRGSAVDVLSALLSAMWSEFRGVCMFVCVCVFCQSKGRYRSKAQSEVIYTILKWKITFPVDGFLISLRPCQKRLETLIRDMQTGCLWNENLQLNITECEKTKKIK